MIITCTNKAERGTEKKLRKKNAEAMKGNRTLVRVSSTLITKNDASEGRSLLSSS